jgi:hypothetical protein
MTSLHVGLSFLRTLSSERLRKLSGYLLVVQDADEPLVVIVPYAMYLDLQHVGSETPTKETK